jgi:3-oxoacyl-[acyl-carrier-protein] synthase-3
MANLPTSHRSTILGVGHYVPSRVVTNHDLAKMMNTSDEWIVQRTGIRERRFIEHTGIGASDLAVPAAKLALEHAAVDVKDIDAIIFATLSPDFTFPGSGCLLGHKLGLPGVPALDVRNQCSGFLYGLSVADAWVKAGVYRRILLVGAEVHSTGVEFADRGRDVAVLFGDGAGAAVIGVSDDGGIESARWGADGSEADLIYYGPKAGEEDSDNGLRMYGKGTFRLGVERMAEMAREVCAEAGWALEDVDLLVPHQANLRIIEAVAKRLGMPLDRVVINIDRYGNTSGASIPIALSEAVATGRVRQGDRIVCIAFGSGVVWGGIALRWIAPTQ